MNFIEYQQREALNYTEEAIFPVPKALTFLKEKDIIEIDDEIYRVIKTITKQTITNTLNHILDSGLLDEKNMSNEFISNLVYRTPPKDGDIVTHTHVDYSERRGHNQAVKTIREFITNMK